MREIAQEIKLMQTVESAGARQALIAPPSPTQKRSSV